MTYYYGFILIPIALSLWLLSSLPDFREHTVVSGLKTGYQLLAADINGDGKLDLVAVDERGTELAWYENPSWERHVLISGVERVINLDFWKSPSGPVIALGYHFETDPDRSTGNLVLLTPGANVREPWQSREIDRVPSIHRVRWIDPRGDGRKLLLVAPMVGVHTSHTPIYFYRPGEWKRELLSNELTGTLHSVVPLKWKGAKGESFLTASFDGLRLFTYRGGRWKSSELSKGDPRACPLCGSSDVRVGHLGKRRFLAAIEPWHGNQVVVYLEDGKRWNRTVIEDGMINGHGLAVGDLDGDGRDEIVVGFRGKGFALYIFEADRAAVKWKRTVLDAGGMAAADCKVADFTGAGRLDVACNGASTGNVKLYENLGKSSH